MDSGALAGVLFAGVALAGVVAATCVFDGVAATGILETLLDAAGVEGAEIKIQ